MWIPQSAGGLEPTRSKESSSWTTWISKAQDLGSRQKLGQWTRSRQLSSSSLGYMPGLGATRVPNCLLGLQIQSTTTPPSWVCAVSGKAWSLPKIDHTSQPTGTKKESQQRWRNTSNLAIHDLPVSSMATLMQATHTSLMVHRDFSIGNSSTWALHSTTLLISSWEPCQWRTAKRMRWLFYSIT